jgi:hypothetical protein
VGFEGPPICDPSVGGSVGPCAGGFVGPVVAENAKLSYMRINLDSLKYDIK